MLISFTQEVSTQAKETDDEVSQQDRDYRCRCCRSHDRRVITTARIWGNDHDGACRMYGIASRGAELQIVEGALDEDRFVADYYEEGERLVAVLGWNSPKQLLSYRQRLLTAYTSSQESNAILEHQMVSGVH